MRRNLTIVTATIVTLAAAAAGGVLAQTRPNADERAEEARQRAETQRQELEQRRVEVRQEVETRRDEFRSRVEERREEVQDRVARMREDLRERLQRIQDERKQRIVERIAEQMDRLNERMVSHYSALLDRLAEILGRIETRADRAEQNGADVSAVRSAIAAAEAVIASVRDAVAAQAGKTYEIPINEEETLRVDVGSARRALHADLRSVREEVRRAFGAVQEAARTLGQIPRVDDEPEAEAEKEEQD